MSKIKERLSGSLSGRAKGIICIIFAAMGFSAMSVFVRLSGEGLPSFQKAFFRNAVALVFITGMMIKQRVPFRPQRQNIPFLFCRSFFGTVGLVANFYAIDHLVLADANMLNKLSPFFAIVFSFFLLKEKPNFVQILGVLCAMLGSVLIIKPGFANAQLIPSLVGLCGGMGAGIAYTFVRRLGANGENSSRIIFWFSLFSCVVCIPFIIADFEPITFKQVALLIGAGCSACVGQLGITKAYLYAPAKEISVYDYTQVIFAALLGFFIFGQVPDALSVLGYLLICGAGVAMFLYNTKNDRKNRLKGTVK